MGTRYLLWVAAGVFLLAGCGGSSSENPAGNIVFTRIHQVNTTYEFTADIVVMNSDGSAQTELANDIGAGLFADPVWSPDGERIAFVREPEDEGDDEIFVMNADGSRQKRLTNGSLAVDRSPTWSPDGRRIAWARDDALFVMNADGTQQSRLLGHPVRSGFTVEDPAWSPDGAKIAFSSGASDPSARSFGGSEIVIVDADGSNPRNLTKPEDDAGHDSEPAWSPDGKRIAFVGYNRDTGYFDVFVMNADGSGKRGLTNDRPGESSPAWSPDGTKIAFVALGMGQEIFVMNADGSGRTNLTRNPAWDDFPAWRPPARGR